MLLLIAERFLFRENHRELRLSPSLAYHTRMWAGSGNVRPESISRGNRIEFSLVRYLMGKNSIRNQRRLDIALRKRLYSMGSS